jgi:anti-sigma factor RsiW
MNCPVSEEQLALYVSGDLACSQSAAVATHIAHCEGCRNTLADLQVSARLLRDGFCDPEAADLRAVRSALLQRLPMQRRSLSWQIWKPAAVAVAGIVALLLFRHPADHLPAAIASGSVQAPPGPTRRIEPVRLVHHRVGRPANKPGLRNVAFRKNQDGQSELTLATADPNVVILLPMDGNNHAN